MEANATSRLNRRGIHRKAEASEAPPTKAAAETGGIHSNAFNFLSAVSSGVDPRTGMYSSSISLPGVAANNLCGPTVQLGLSFSPLNPVNAGFGIGWSLTTTRYDSRRKRLSLSSGESFLLDTFVNDTATFKDRKLRSFDMIRDGFDGEYRIVHKSGKMEILRAESGSEGVSVLCEVRSPEGRVVTLEQAAANGVVKLESVTDGTGRVLLTVAYALSSTIVTLNPESSQAGAFTFHLGNDRLERVALPQGYGDGWLFGYEEIVTGLLLLKTTTVPTGGQEEVTYKEDGHALPGAGSQPLSHMPVVTALRRDPGHGQPVMLTRYTYSTRNFFGYGALNDWTDDEDNLYRVVMAPGQRYEYTSTETQYDGIEPVRTVERTFNRFHLLTLERSVQDGCVKEVETVYDDVPSSSFANQAPWCQLPSEVRTRYFRDAEAARVREDVESRTYDSHGNVLTHTDVQGAVELRSYYPVEGAAGQCPPDPLGFVRFLGEKRVSPPSGSAGAARVSRYRYELLQPYLPGNSPHVVSSFEESLVENTEGGLDLLSDVTYAYVDDQGPHHGRMLGSLATMDGVPNVSAFIYTLSADEQHDGQCGRDEKRPSCLQRDALGLMHPSVVTSKITRGSNGNETVEVTRFSAHSLISGSCVMDQGRNGVIARYAHDLLGRLVEETVAADSDFPATQRTSYIVSSRQSSKLTTDAAGQSVRVELDGFGREVRRVAVDWLGDGQEQVVWQVTFDALGRMREQTTTDSGVPLALHGRIVNAGAALSLTTRYLYDGWGNAAEEIKPDGVTVHHRIDPVSRVSETWEAAAGNKGGVTRTFSSLTGKALTVDTLRADATVMSAMTCAYDGFDRCTMQTLSGEGIQERTTRHRYDPYGRLIESTLPDGAIVSRSYPAYSAEDLMTGVAIRHESLGENEVLLGEQAFDGLGRRSLFRAGGRSTTYRYDSPVSCEPDHVDLPSGQTLHCEYQKYLADGLVRLASSDETITFTRDAVLGHVTRAENAVASVESTYFPSGNVKTEHSIVGGVHREAGYRYSLLGKGVSRTALDGSAGTFGYDLSGRLVLLDDGDVMFAFAYDDLSRPSHIHSETKDGSRVMDVALGYDAFDRETDRRIDVRLGKQSFSRSVRQEYAADDKLSRRISEGEEGGRSESYTYDIRGRVDSYICDGATLPEDHSGRAIRQQIFSFDALDNVREMITRYADAAEADEVSVFAYGESDPTQLVEWLRRKEGQPERRLSFTYDASGNLTRDEEGRKLVYDAMGRLCGWTHGSESCAFGYDPLDRICSVEDTFGLRHRYYEKGQLAYEDGEGHSSAFHAHGGASLAETRLSDGIREAILLGADAQGSTIFELSDEARVPVYTPYGHAPATSGTSDVAYAGATRDRSTGLYLLDSYRAYNPVLMRFHSPDSASPFGDGGLNAYAYAAGDPVNHVDPTGQSLFAWLIAGVGAAIAIGLTIASWGTLAPAMSAVGSTLFGSLAAPATPFAFSAAAIGTTAGSTAASAVTSTTVAAATAAQWGHALAGLGGLVSVPLDLGAAAAEEAGDEELAGWLGFAGGALGFVGDAAAFKPAVKWLAKLSKYVETSDLGRVAAKPRVFKNDPSLKRQAVNAWDYIFMKSVGYPPNVRDAGGAPVKNARASNAPAGAKHTEDTVTRQNKVLRATSADGINFGENSRSPSALSNVSAMNRSGYPDARTPSPEFYTPTASPEPANWRTGPGVMVRHRRRFSWP
jgi:RHS repeat-associated protein